MVKREPDGAFRASPHLNPPHMNRRTRSYATRMALITAGLVSASSYAAAQGTPGNAKVEEQIVATSGNAIKFLVSDSGAHVAAISRKGSRFVVLVDGAEGPPFDEILNNADVVLTPDGTRFAYAGRNGQEYVGNRRWQRTGTQDPRRAAAYRRSRSSRSRQQPTRLLRRRKA